MTSFSNHVQGVFGYRDLGEPPFPEYPVTWLTEERGGLPKTPLLHAREVTTMWIWKKMVSLVVVGLLLVLLWAVSHISHWWRRGVPSRLPLPLLGNCLPALYLSTVEFWQRVYSSSTAPYIGIFFFTRPALVLRDPKVIMEVLEKKASYFSSHGMYINEEHDPMGMSLFHLYGSKWKETRSKLSTYFSPAKVKAMTDISERSADRLLEHFRGRVNEDVEIHSAAMKFSIDVTAASVFGVESNVFEEGEASRFLIASKDLNTPQSMLKVFASFVSPLLFHLMRLNSFSSQTNEFITILVQGAIEASMKNKSQQNFIQGMVQLMENDKNFGEKFVVSQGAVLWVGGVETTAATLGSCLFELAGDVTLQDQLREDLSTPRGSQLLRDVIAEALRKYPPFSILTRSCTKVCTLDCGLNVEEGTLIFVPTYSLHHDPEIYPAPEEFKLGREYPKGAYLPFGSGPRTCIGMRMAELILELALKKLLQNYRFLPSPKSPYPLKLAPQAFFTTADGGLWIRIEKV